MTVTADPTPNSGKESLQQIYETKKTKGDYKMTKATIEHLESKLKLSRTIRGETAKLMRYELDDFRSYKSQINTDRKLSSDGKSEEIQELKKTYEKRVLQLSQELKKQESDALDVAKSGANKILAGELPKVDAQKQAIFNRKADALKARATFATNSGDAIAAIKELSELAADEPSLSAQIQPSVLQLGEKALANTDPSDIVQTKKVLAQIFESTSSSALPSGGKEALDIIGTADAILETPMFIGTVPNALEEITPNTAKHINAPNEYLEQSEGGTQ